MKKNRIRQLLLVGCLIATTCFAMAYAGKTSLTTSGIVQTASSKNGIVTLSGSLTQDKIYSGSDGMVSLALTINTDDITDNSIAGDAGNIGHVDMVIVLDRSGSMAGKKLDDAKKAAMNLISKLSPSDRFALVTYSNTAVRLSDLEYVTPSTRERLRNAISKISAGGGTNLGHGLTEGINMLTRAEKASNLGRVVLISDGLANQGIIDPNVLGNMASVAAEKDFSITTVGLGHDFNEQLMTAIADRGTGTYYYLENPSAFAAVFQKEFHRANTVAASAVKIRIEEKNGIKLVNAGGYPISYKNNTAIFFPGDLQSDETRKLFLNLKVPTGREQTFNIDGIDLSYRFAGQAYTVKLSTPFTLACVTDHKAAIASIDKDTWGYKVIKEDFNRLKEEVAKDIKIGRKKEALKRIEQYHSTQQTINAQVQSEAVAGNQKKDLKNIRDTQADTNTGKESEVREKQKINAKALQYEGYSGRR
jgi:Ca-activated chloride channel family protein